MQTAEQQTTTEIIDERDFLNEPEKFLELKSDPQDNTVEEKFQFKDLDEVKRTLNIDLEKWEKINESQGGDVLKKGGQELMYKDADGQEFSMTAAMKGTEHERAHAEVLQNLYAQGFSATEFTNYSLGEPVKELHVYFADEKGRVSYEIYKLIEQSVPEQLELVNSPEAEKADEVIEDLELPDLSPTGPEPVVISLDEVLNFGTNNLEASVLVGNGVEVFQEQENEFNFQDYFQEPKTTVNPTMIMVSEKKNLGEKISLLVSEAEQKTVQEESLTATYIEPQKDAGNFSQPQDVESTPKILDAPGTFVSSEVTVIIPTTAGKVGSEGTLSIVEKTTALFKEVEIETVQTTKIIAEAEKMAPKIDRSEENIVEDEPQEAQITTSTPTINKLSIKSREIIKPMEISENEIVESLPDIHLVLQSETSRVTKAEKNIVSIVPPVLVAKSAPETTRVPVSPRVYAKPQEQQSERPSAETDFIEIKESPVEIPKTVTQPEPVVAIQETNTKPPTIEQVGVETMKPIISEIKPAAMEVQKIEPAAETNIQTPVFESPIKPVVIIPKQRTEFNAQAPELKVTSEHSEPTTEIITEKSTVPEGNATNQDTKLAIREVINIDALKALAPLLPKMQPTIEAKNSSLYQELHQATLPTTLKEQPSRVSRPAAATVRIVHSDSLRRIEDEIKIIQKLILPSSVIQTRQDRPVFGQKIQPIRLSAVKTADQDVPIRQTVQELRPRRSLPLDQTVDEVNNQTSTGNQTFNIAA